jgi:hypothetical protein
MATRFDYRNLAGLCKEENCSEGGKSHEGGIATDTNFGKGQRSNFSNFQQTTKQWGIGELELVIVRSSSVKKYASSTSVTHRATIAGPGL